MQGLLVKQAFAQDYNVWVNYLSKFNFNNEPPTFEYLFRDSTMDIDADPEYDKLNFLPSNVCDEKGNLNLYLTQDRQTDWLQFRNAKNTCVAKSEYRPYYPDVRLLKLTDTVYVFLNVKGSLFGKDPLERNPIRIAQAQQKVIDFNKDSAGLYIGFIYQNQHLENGDCNSIIPINRIYTKPFGDITITKNEDSSWWILSECSDSLFAFKLNLDGTVNPPVISAMNSIRIIKDSLSYFSPESFLRFSNNGKHLLHTLSRYTNSWTQHDQSGLYYYEFDKNKGTINRKQIIEETLKTEPNQPHVPSIHSIVFSPNDSMFYANHINSIIIGSHVAQYKTHETDIKQSKYIVIKGFMPKMSLGANKRVYLESLDGYYASMIYRPNVYGQGCTFLTDAFKVKCVLHRKLWNPACVIGLYEFPFSIYHGYNLDYDFKTQCENKIQILNRSDTLRLRNFRWYLYGPDGYYDSAYASNPVFKVPQSGVYWLKFNGETQTGYRPWYSDTLVVNLPPKPVASFETKTQQFCRYANIAFSDASLANASDSTKFRFHWFFGDGNDTIISGTNKGDVFHPYEQTGNYDISMTFFNGHCSDTFVLQQPIKIIDAPKPGINIDFTSGCQPHQITLADAYVDAIDSVSYSFGDGFILTQKQHVLNHKHTYTKPGYYFVRQKLFGPTGCVSADSVLVAVHQGFDSATSLHLHYATLIEAENTHQIFWQNLADAKRYVLNQQTGSAWQKIYEGKDTLYEHIPAQAIGVHRYQINAYDTCGKSLASNTGTTLLLQGKTQENEYAILHWNDYDYWPMGISAYSLEKQNPLNQEWEMLLSTTDTAATDLNFFDVQYDEACYRVKAIANQNSTYQSTSNRICLPYSPLFWIPDAFTPNGDGRNDAFKPMSSGILNEGYELLIYNRWGALVFATQNRNTAWDGSYEGKPVPEGLYVYQIKFNYTDQKGITRKKNHKGQVSLIR